MNFDYVIQQGATWRRTVFWTNPDGSPVILRGASARLQIRYWPTSPVAVLDLNSADGSLVINSSAGSVSWDVSADTTAGLKLPPGLRNPFDKQSKLGSYDLLVGLGAEEYRIQQGLVYLSLGVTR